MVADLVSCTECGAGNPPAAPWCSQCQTPSAAPGWSCPTCERRNDLPATACPACGTSLFDTSLRRRRPADAPAAARMFPGGGLIAGGHVLAGLLVAGPAFVAAVAAVLLLTVAPAFSLVLVVLIAGLWVASYYETARTAAGAVPPVVLTPRVLSLLSGGTVALSFVFLIAGLGS